MSDQVNIGAGSDDLLAPEAFDRIRRAQAELEVLERAQADEEALCRAQPVDGAPDDETRPVEPPGLKSIQPPLRRTLMSDTFKALLQKVIGSFIGRVILAAYTLVVVPFLPGAIKAVNDLLGYGLTEQQVQAYAEKATLGIGALAAIWLVNNGLFERAALLIKKVVETGEDTQEEPR